jgi:hypothetical protein
MPVVGETSAEVAVAEVRDLDADVVCIDFALLADLQYWVSTR